MPFIFHFHHLSLMRPARFFFGLLFAAVFVITLLKILFFGIVAAAIFGGIFFLGRAFRRHRGRGYYGHPGYAAFGNSPWQQPFLQQESSPFAQPLDPNWQPRQQKAPMGRRIEVL